MLLAGPDFDEKMQQCVSFPAEITLQETLYRKIAAMREIFDSGCRKIAALRQNPLGCVNILGNYRISSMVRAFLTDRIRRDAFGRRKGHDRTEKGVKG